MKRKAFVVSVGLILLISLVFVMYIKSQSFLAMAASTLSLEATKALNTEIKIGKIDIQSVNQIGAENIVILDKTGASIVLAERVKIQFSPLDMIRGAALLSSIKTIEVEKPLLTMTYRENGTWNYEDALPASDDKPSEFQGKIVIKDGTASVNFQNKNFILEKVAGHFDFVTPPAMSFAADFMHNSGKTEISGSIKGKDPALTVKAENINIEDYLDFLPENMTVKIKKGTLKSLNVTVLQTKGEYEVNGEALALGVNLDVEGTAIEDIDGLVLFNEKNLRLFSRGKVKDQPIVLKGTATLDVVEPILNMQVSSSGFDVSKILNSCPLLGKVAFDANINGPYSNPTVEGTFKVAAGTLYGYDLQNMKAKAFFADGVLAVENIEGEIADGKIIGNGIYNAKNDAYRFKIKTENLPVDTFAQYVPGVSGLLQSDIVIEGQGADIGKALIFGSAAINDGKYKNMDFHRLNANFYKDKENISLDYISLILPQGEIGAQGKITNNQIDLSFRGSKFDLATLARLEPKADISGMVDFSGTIGGSLDNPRVLMELSAVDGKVFAQPYQTAGGRMKIENHTVYIDGLSLKNGGTEHLANGSIALGGARPIDIKVATKKARAENLIKLAFDEDLTGNVNNMLSITGSLDDLKIAGSLDFYEGSLRGVFIKSAKGNYLWQNGKMVLREFFVSAPNLKVRLDGELGPNNELDFMIAADEIDFGKINIKLPYPASGIGSFTGKLTGTLDEPEFAGKLFAEKLNFNDRIITDVNGQISFKNKRLELSSVGFSQEEGTFNLSGGIDLNTENIYGNLTVKKGSLAAILALAGIKDEWVEGNLDGSVLVAGTVAKPYIRLNGIVAEGSIKGAPLKNLSLDVVVNGKIIKLNKFSAEQNTGVLVAQGQIDLEGPIALECSGDNIDAGLLLRLADIKTDMQGSLNFGAQITGTAENPKVDLSVDVKNGGNGKTTFDTLYGMFRLENGIIQVDQLLAQKDIYKISAYGVIPLAAITKENQDNVTLKNQMDLKISLDQANLSILPLLTNGVSWALGETKGFVDITGTLEHPLVNGEILISDGAVKFDDLGKPLENIALDVKFLGDRLELRKFAGAMGKGTYQMTGSSHIDGSGLSNYEFVLDLNQLEIASKYYTGPLQGHLTLSQDKLWKYIVPKIAGNLDFAYCTIDIPVLPESEEAMPRIKLDLSIALGKKVRLYNSFLYDIWLDGHAKFEGSTRYPQASGEITALRGTVNYLKTPFQIKEATAYFNQVNSFLPSLHLEADTRLQRTKVYMQVDGPADKLNIKLNSDPEMNEAELLSLLTLRSKYDKSNRTNNDGIGTDELKAFVDIGLQMSFLSEVENVMRNALGVDEFKVVRETLSGSNTKDDEEGYNVEIGKYIDDKIMLRYITGVDGNNDYKFGVRYDISRHISVTTDIDQDSEASFGVEARFKF